MQLPFAGLLGLASGAMGFVQKVFSQQGSGADFDAELTTAMAGKTDAGKGAALSQILSGDGTVDEASFKELISTPAGMLLFQFMTTLKEMGLNTSDIQLLVNGGGALISDEALGTILAQQGLGQKDLAALMADPAMKAELKTQLASSFETVLDGQAMKDGIDADALSALTASDADAVDSIIERIMSGKQLPAGQNAVSADRIPDQDAALKIGFIQKNISHMTGEIKTLVAEALKKTVSAEASAQSGSEGAMKVETMIRTAGDTFGVNSDVMNDLFFAADEAARKQAVDQVTARVNAYLKSQAGQELSAETADALAFLKSAMSEQEFSGINTSLKLWQPGQALPDTQVLMDRQAYEALARSLGRQAPESLYEQHMKQVMDQLRQALPSQMKNSEGQVTLRLHPPMLGRVDVSMTMQDGQLQAAFKTDQLVTRDILIQNMQVLKDALTEQGIRATQFTVSTAFDHGSLNDGYAFAQQDRHGQGSSRQGRSSGFHGGFSGNDDEYYSPQPSEGAGLDLFA